MEYKVIMDQIKSFHDLRTWKEAHALVLDVYQLSSSFPRDEQYGLTSQLRRAAVSVPSNIAEGMGRATKKDFIRFLIQARGSVQEVLYQLFLAKDLCYLDDKLHQDLTMRYNGLNAGLNAHINRLDT